MLVFASRKPSSGGVTSFNGRVGVVVPAGGDYSVGEVTGAAPLASPAFTGAPTVPEAPDLDNTTKAASTSWVTRAINEGPTDDTGWVDFSTLGYENSWADWTSPAQFRKIGNVVYLRGAIQGGASGSQVTTNPIPYPPPAFTGLPQVANTALTANALVVNITGVMELYYPSTSLTFLSGSYLTD